MTSQDPMFECGYIKSRLRDNSMSQEIPVVLTSWITSVAGDALAMSFGGMTDGNSSIYAAAVAAAYGYHFSFLCEPT
jgi:hypothetical protein